MQAKYAILFSMKFRQSLFWDTNLKNIDKKKHAYYIIERILDFGRDSEVRWMWREYNKKLLKNVVEKSRSLHPQTRVLWETFLKQK